MEKAIVVVRPKQKKHLNIGDYIQSLATSQFVNQVDYYIDRNDLKSFDKKAKVVVNGCYQWHPKEDWPPSDTLSCLFLSIHIFPFAEDEMFDIEYMDFWKRHSPIGCRDLNTLRMFQSRGIPAYFSNCITLTLGNHFHFNGQRKGICFVDPFIPVKPIFVHRRGMDVPVFKEWMKMIWFASLHPFKSRRLFKINFFSLYGPKWGMSNKKGKKKMIYKFYQATQFYRTYSSVFSDSVIFHADYITHMYRVRQPEPETDEELHQVAKELILKYASSELVVTSRIHAALPCLGLETPVIFMIHEDMESSKIVFNTPGRFDGIVEMMRCMRIKKGKIVVEDDVLRNIGKIGLHSTFKNKDHWKTYASEIKERVVRFFDS